MKTHLKRKTTTYIIERRFELSRHHLANLLEAFERALPAARGACKASARAERRDRQDLDRYADSKRKACS